MQRIVVMGPPGSGKSTLAREIGRRCGLPVFHLDQTYWRAGWIEAPEAEFRAEVERLAALPAWVIEGNYTSSTLAPRWRAAEAVIYLDVPAPIATARIVKRTALSYGRVRADAAPGCPEHWDPAFLRFAWSWNRIRRKRNLLLVAGFPRQSFIVRNRRDRHRVLAALSAQRSVGDHPAATSGNAGHAPRVQSSARWFMRWLALLPFLGILVGTPFLNRVTPFVLGFPLILAWLVFWVVATAAIMALIYATDPANREPRQPAATRDRTMSAALAIIFGFVAARPGARYPGPQGQDAWTWSNGPWAAAASARSSCSC